MKRPLILAMLVAVSIGNAQTGSLADLTRSQSGISKRETSTFREGNSGKYDSKAFPKGDLLERSNSDNFRVAPGATHTLMDVKGSGVITHIWMTFLGPERQDWAPNGSATHQDMLLRVYWDGNPKPAIESPVGDFFANCFGRRSSVISLPVIVEDADSYNCYWQMPFRRSAKIEIVNQGTQNINLLYYNIDWIQKPIAKDVPYFYAQYRQEYPVEHGKDYTVLETQGKGHYVGTVMAVRTRSPSWFGEGDEKVYIDGEDHASIWGTGTEDYFLSAWGLQKTSTPYFGVPHFDQWGIVGGHTSAYRWHINDPLVFQKGIKVTFEHFGWMSPDENKDYKSMSWNEREDDYSSVAFWYQTGIPTFSARAPGGAERRLPSLERVTAYARDAEQHGIGETTRQNLDLYPGSHVLYMPKEDQISPTNLRPSANDLSKAWISIPITVKEKEPLRLVLNMTTSYDFGRYQAFLVGPVKGVRVIRGDPALKGSFRIESLFETALAEPKIQLGPEGVKLGGPIDLYSKDVENKEIHLLDFWPEPGDYILKLQCVGKNPLSQGYYLGIESVRLRERRSRVKQMGWDKDKDWRKEPKLYG